MNAWTIKNVRRESSLNFKTLVAMISKPNIGEQAYNEILQILQPYRGKHGLYIIKPKTKDVLQAVCEKLGYECKSDIAYIGKAAKTKNSDLFKRSKQEMGWSNFEGATFVKKIGTYLGFDIKDKTNKDLKERTKHFICSNFIVECVEFDCGTDLLIIETDYITKYKPCLNSKKNSKSKIEVSILLKD